MTNSLLVSIPLFTVAAQNSGSMITSEISSRTGPSPLHRDGFGRFNDLIQPTCACRRATMLHSKPLKTSTFHSTKRSILLLLGMDPTISRGNPRRHSSPIDDTCESWRNKVCVWPFPCRHTKSGLGIHHLPKPACVRRPAVSCEM